MRVDSPLIGREPFDPAAPLSQMPEVAAVEPSSQTADHAADDSAAENDSIPVSAPAEAAPWMDPRLGGRAAIGSPIDYLPLLSEVHGKLQSRHDVVAKYGSVAIQDELANHQLLNAYLNSLIA